MRKVLLAAIVVVASLGPSADAGTSSRLYLLGSERGSAGIWSTDPHDPYAAEASVGWGCGVNDDGLSLVPCASNQSGQTLFLFPFNPGALLEGPITWTEASAPAFHFELDVAMTTGSYTVHAYVQHGGSTWESSPATEVAPGVFEGRLPSGASIQAAPATMIAVGVRVFRDANGVGHFRGYDVKTAGASYIDLMEPVQAKAFPELDAENTYAPQPGAFSSVDHWFTFNDANWDVIPFQGNTSTALTVPFSLQHEAAAVYAYVDDWAQPLIHRAVRRQQPEPRNLSSPNVEIRKGTILEAEGQRAAATAALPAGDYTVSVARGGGNTLPLDIPYQGYIVIAHGARTLRSLQFKFPQGVMVNITSPAVNNFAPGLEPFLVPREATAIDFEFSSDSLNPAEPDWYLSWSIFGYASGTARRHSRTIAGDEGVGVLTANPVRGRASVTSQNILFDVKMTFAYTPA